ncbi:hypothetical protein ACFW84_28370 [Streptomyces anulatus]|uniref:hypothetical protein n=1 Tax=Streptomyces anulatus TaxID=1892 RepID=UPI0036915FC8
MRTPPKLSDLVARRGFLVGAGALETAIDTLRADRTLLVTAHREATIKRLPRTIRLDENALLAHN